MAKREHTLVLDIGSTAIHVGEFDIDPQGGGIVLHAFDNVEFPDSPSETNRTDVIAAAVQKTLDSGKFTAKKCSVCVSGQAAFMRFVKLPPVTDDDASIRQIVEYEARQNVPFPMEEVIWDYQLIGSQEDDLEVMFAVIKNEIVDGVIAAVTSVGLRPNLVDFAPAALYNAARANYIGEDECAMLLDIGGRCTNLLFLDSGRFFARAIPIAGFSITQQVAKEFGISTDEAEVLKRRHGFVALGGAYEEPESEVAATISKIIRNVMTRLHGEINRSINVYRTQQKGNKPVRLYLAGGSSTMQWTDTFFSEKLRMEVTWFNPFKVVTLGPNVDAAKLQEVAHVMPEVVGVALRHAVECPVQISLITENLKKASAFNQRKPFIVAAGVVWLLILAVFWAINFRKAEWYTEAIAYKSDRIERLDSSFKIIKRALEATEAADKKFEELKGVLDQRYIWSTFLNTMQATKPLDVWLVYIKPLDDPTKKPTGGASEEDRRLGEMFGGGFSFDPGGGVKETTKDNVEWFELFGHCIQIPERDEQGKLSRPVFADAQVETFTRLAGEMTADLEGKDDDAAKFRKEAIAAFQPNFTTNRVDEQTRLPEIFLNSLRFHPTFSANPQETSFVSFQPDQKVRNLTSFIIQVKVATPIPVKR